MTESSRVGGIPPKNASLSGVGKVTIFSTPIDNVKNGVVEKVEGKIGAIDRKNGFVKRLGKRGIKHMVGRVRKWRGGKMGVIC